MADKSDSYIKYLMLLPTLILILSITLFPLVLNFIFSLHRLYGIFTTIPPSETFAGIDNYIEILQEDYFQVSVQITTIYVLGAIIIELLFGMGVALLVNSLSRGRKIVTTLFIIPLAISPVIYGSIWRLSLNAEYGIIPYYINRIFALAIQPLGYGSALYTLIIIDALQWTPFVFLIIYAGLTALPQDPYDSALVDGASSFQIFRYITIPLLRPALGVAILFRGIGAFKAFDLVSILTGGGPVRSTTTLSYYIYQIFYHYFDVGKAAAAAVLITFVLLITFQIISKLTKIFWRA